MPVSATNAATLNIVLTTRRTQLAFRLVATMLIVACYFVPIGLIPVLSWMFVYAALQVGELIIFPTDKGGLSTATPVGYVVGLIILSLNGVVFGGFALIAIATLGPWGFVCAANILAGSTLNTVLTTIDDKHSFRASIAPYLIYAAIVAGALFMYKAGVGVAIGVAFGYLLFMLSALKLWTQASLARAEQRKIEVALGLSARQAIAANESKSAFLATVSHEIRTPMNGIVGVLHLLKSENLSEDGRKLLSEAISCSSVLGQLINDVLDLSKIEAGKLELSPEPTDIDEALRGVVDLVRPQATAKGLDVTVAVDADLPLVLVDPVRLRQCLFNLVGNAVKFTLLGSIHIRLSQVADDRFRFEVEDTGIGISAAAIPRLFNRFEQADDTATRTFGGSGLGLAISKNLAEMMSGGIGCESVEGVGSIFWFEFVAKTTVAGAQGASQPAFLDGLRVLVVDDNATNRLVGSKILESLGAVVVTREDGQSAIKAVSEQAFDLVLMDINMPSMDGLEATRRIRSMCSPVRDLPIIALTANVMAHQRDAYVKAGVDGVVAKPISPTALLEEINRVFSASTPDPQDREDASVATAEYSGDPLRVRSATY